MTVAQNIEFGLKIRKIALEERAKRCEELLDLVDLAGLGERYANQLSGGQQQRVALARALAYQPSVLLLDEPLGALDVKIRAQLRRSLKEVQRSLKVTTILVTHDQEEAFELGDRIAVLERGVLREVGDPERLYGRPQSLFVASFLGGGSVLAGRVKENAAHFGPLVLPLPEDAPHEETAPVQLLIRPEQVLLQPKQPAAGEAVLGKGSIVEQTFNGAQWRLRLRLPQMPGTRQISPVPPFGEEGLLIDTIVPRESLPQNAEHWVSLRGWTILQQAPPRILALDTGVGRPVSLMLAHLFAQKMRGSVSVMGWTHEMSEETRETIKRRIAEAGLAEAEFQMRTGRLANQIETHRAGALVDLVILPRRFHRHGRPMNLATATFLATADVPVLIAGDQDCQSIQRMLICTRAGEPGKSSVRFGGRFARHLEAAVTLLHVTTNAVKVSPRIRLHLERAAASLAALDVRSETRIRTGSVRDEVVQEARGHDLVVIGGHGPRLHSVFRTDDMTTDLLERVPVPVLVIPTEP
jgi:energy-coupling factor transporter ATP-binding protein EcfA2/nucleotide-binding universal stress UspA family protein